MASPIEFRQTLSLAADAATTSVDVLHQKLSSCHVVWTGADAVDGTFDLQWSNDGLNWEDEDAAAIAIGAADGTKLWKNLACGQRFMRVNVAHGSNTVGTLSVFLVAKP